MAQCALTNSVLTPLDPPTVNAPAGSGPRHLVLNRAGTDLYVLTEFSCEVLHFRRNAETGTLLYAGKAGAHRTDRGLAHSRFGADPLAEHLIWGADLHFNADETVLWASERTESSLATVHLDSGNNPHTATTFADTETQPRGFAVSADGRFLLCTGERSTTVSLFAAAPDGSLSLLTQQPTGDGANWARFLP